MVQDAEVHADEDKRRREEAETRNQAETLVYQTENFLKENEEKVSDDVKSKVNSALDEAKEALKGEDIERINSAVEKLASESQAIGQAMYSESGAAADSGAEGGATGSAESQAGDEDVMDAEIVDEDEKKQ